MIRNRPSLTLGPAPSAVASLCCLTDRGVHGLLLTTTLPGIVLPQTGGAAAVPRPPPYAIQAPTIRKKHVFDRRGGDAKASGVKSDTVGMVKCARQRCCSKGAAFRSERCKGKDAPDDFVTFRRGHPAHYQPEARQFLARTDPDHNSSRPENWAIQSDRGRPFTVIFCNLRTAPVET